MEEEGLTGLRESRESAQGALSAQGDCRGTQGARRNSGRLEELSELRVTQGAWSNRGGSSE